MANYIPMLDSATFRGAVGVFGVGALLLVLQGLVRALPVGPARGRRRRAALRPARQRGGHRRGLAGLRLVAGPGADLAAAQGLLRDPVLGRRPRSAVHLDTAHAGGLAGTGAGLRRPHPPEPARRAAAVRGGAGRRLRHAAGLPDARREQRGAPRHAHLGHALRRRPGHRAAGAGGAAGAGAAAAAGGRAAPAARGAAGVDAAVRGRRRDRPHHPAAATSRSRRITTAASSA